MQIPCSLLVIGFAAHRNPFAEIQARVYNELDNVPAAVLFTIYSLRGFTNVVLFMSTLLDLDFAKPRFQLCAQASFAISNYMKRITHDVK